jgi:hypothetical protein
MKAYHLQKHTPLQANSAPWLGASTHFPALFQPLELSGALQALAAATLSTSSSKPPLMPVIFHRTHSTTHGGARSLRCPECRYRFAVQQRSTLLPTVSPAARPMRLRLLRRTRTCTGCHSQWRWVQRAAHLMIMLAPDLL